YNFSGGYFSSGYESISSNGMAFFNQSGGTNQAGELYLGLLPPGSATYTLSGGVLNANDENIGGAPPDTVVTGGRGIFNQSGGIHTVYRTLHLADVPLSNGTYTLTGG